MAEIDVKIDASIIPEAARKLTDAMTSKEAAIATGEAILDETRQFYLGKKGRKFWQQIGMAFSNQSIPGAARVVVSGDKAMLLIHKIEGGRIRAKTALMLAIPASQQARDAGSPSLGKCPPDLFVMRFKKKNRAALVQNMGKGKRLKVWYWLKKYVDQLPDPDPIPNIRKLNYRATAAFSYFMSMAANEAKKI